MHVPTDQQIVDIFTKPLDLDKLRHFSGAVGVQHLDLPNMRWRNENTNERDGVVHRNWTNVNNVV